MICVQIERPIKVEFKKTEFRKKIRKDIEEVYNTKSFLDIKLGYKFNLWMNTRENGYCPKCDGKLHRFTLKFSAGYEYPAVPGYFDFCDNPCCEDHKPDFEEIVDAIMGVIIWPSIILHVQPDVHIGCDSGFSAFAPDIFQPLYLSPVARGTYDKLKCELKEQASKNRQLDNEIQRLNEELCSLDDQNLVLKSENEEKEKEISCLEMQVKRLNGIHNCEDLKEIKRLKKALRKAEEKVAILNEKYLPRYPFGNFGTITK
jgi:hypothetical protein